MPPPDQAATMDRYEAGRKRRRAGEVYGDEKFLAGHNVKFKEG